MNDDHYLLTLLINDSTILGTKTTICDYKSIPHPLKKKKKVKIELKGIISDETSGQFTQLIPKA